MEFQYAGVGKIPEDTVLLNCSGTGITSFPEAHDLPQGLRVLDCHRTKIRSLPKLPAGLQELYCSDTLITSLPALPKGLRILYCSSTLITSLPALPQSLRKLSCYDTKIRSLPALPQGLQELVCSYTNIVGLPELPQGLHVLYYDDIKIYELPQKVIRFLNNKEITKYNKWLQNIKMFQCMYKKKYLRKQRKKKMTMRIANWIYEYGNRPGNVFARMAIERAKERFRNKN